MNRVLNPDGSIGTDDLRRLNGKVVLVKSTRDRRNPPTAMRGWLEVHEQSSAAADVRVVVDFPQMFTIRAHRRNIPLDSAQLRKLLESEHEGTFSLTIDDELE